MASVNCFRTDDSQPSSSRVSDVNAHSSNYQGNIREKLLDTDQVFRLLDDECRMLEKKYPNLGRIETRIVSKSNGNSVKIRNIAIRRAAKGSSSRELRESLKLHSESIAWAEEESEELALAYGARAQSLCQLQLYEECMEDINRAFKITRSTDTKVKLEGLQRHCFVQKEALLPTSQMKLRAIRDPPSFELVEMNSALAANVDECKRSEWQNRCRFGNANITNASPKIRLICDANNWRQSVEASDHIETGEVLTTQKWFVVFLKWRYRYERCSYCLNLCVTLIPCPTCIVMMYCSETCRKHAYDSYHCVECKIIKLLPEPEKLYDIKAGVAIRILLVGTNQGSHLGYLMSRIKTHGHRMRNFPSLGNSFLDDFMAYMHLHHKSRFPERVKQLIPWVSKTIVVLEKARYFDGHPSFRVDPRNPDSLLTDAKRFAAQVLISNIVGMIPHYMTFRILNTVIGSGYFPLYSVFMPSCDPNVHVITRGRETAFIANRPILMGEKLQIASVAFYTSCEAEERQKLFYDTYERACHCTACDNDWPIAEILKQSPPQYLGHVVPKKVMCELWLIISPMVNAAELKSLPFTKILRNMLFLCTWLFLNIKQPAFEHGEIQTIAYTLMTLRYDTFCQNIPADEIFNHLHTTLLQVASRLGFNVKECTHTAPTPAVSDEPQYHQL